ncbi:MAG: DMT family transporter, partial [Ramlibacter sp.]|nr:DMT family transporter [Ramlibacter sp.]
MAARGARTVSGTPQATADSNESLPAGGLLPALALVLNAFVWGVSWWPFRQLQGQGLHPLWATALIYLVSMACLIALRPRVWGGFRGHPLLWLLAAAAGLTNVGFNWAVTVGDVVRVVLLFYLMPAWTVVLAWPMLGEKPTLLSLLRLAMAMAGVAIVLKTA